LITFELVAFHRMKNKREKKRRNENRAVCRIIDQDMVSLLTNKSK